MKAAWPACLGSSPQRRLEKSSWPTTCARQRTRIDRARTGRHPADLVETGNLLRTQPDAFPMRHRSNRPKPSPERHDVVVIGAGQAGLSVGYHLKRRASTTSFSMCAPHRRCLAQPLGFAAALHPGEVRLARRLSASRRNRDTFPDQGRDGGLPREHMPRTFRLPVRLNARSRRLRKAERPLSRGNRRRRL
jgi:putative flavoprotein involved in K+ transport